MKLESMPLPEAVEPARAGAASGRRVYAWLFVVGAVLWLLGCYSGTVQSMVAIWKRSDTFAHGFLVVPISLWLIWHRRHDLGTRDIRAEFIVLPLLAFAGFAWLLGELAGARVVQQYAVVAMIPLAVWMIVGRQIVWSLAFPLFFLLFAVPFGEFLLPPLMQHTADFTISALKLSGIPVYRDGLYFTIPSGSWSVVEACSGLRYLIASLSVGVLYAYFMYRSVVRRALFIIAAMVVPIFANWLRAYMIVMIGHLSGMKYAAGVDHLVYGWVFFGIVMMVLFSIGAIWRQDSDSHAEDAQSMTARQPRVAPYPALVAATMAVAVTTAVWPAAAAYLERLNANVTPQLDTPIAAAGWQPRSEPVTAWTPHFATPAARINQAYSANAAPVGLFIGYYRNQRQGSELITSANTLVGTGDSAWGNIGETPRTLEFDGERLSSVEAELKGSQTRLLVWRWYRVDGEHTASAYWAKLLQARSRLFGRGDDAAVIMVYTEFDTARDAAASRLNSFVSAMLPAINRSVDHAR